MTKIMDKVIPKIAMPIIILAAILLVFTIVSSSKQTGEENNAYIRAINCIVSIRSTSDGEPLNKDIDLCYATVEADMGIKLKRYDQ